MTDAKNNIDPKDIEKFVRSRVVHSYNKQIFDEQLQDQVQKNLIKIQEALVKQMKRKMILKSQQQSQLQKRQRLRKELDEKLQKSENKRQKQKQQRQKKISIEKKQRSQLFNQRLAELKKKQRQIVEERLKIYEQKSKISGPTFNKVTSAISLIQQPHYKRKLILQESEYNRLKNIVQQKKAFSATRLKKKQLSLTQIRPRENRYDSLEQQKINKMGEHLQKIQQTRKKREQALNKKINNLKFAEQQSSKLRSQRMKLLMESQRQKQQNIIMKLSKIVSPSSSSKLNPQRKNSQKQLINSLPKGSIIFEQSEDRQKHSYRKQIKQQIKEYMMNQKQKFLS